MSEEQWSVVEKSEESGNDLAHHWRMVYLRSNLGRYRPGLKCVDCGEVKVLSDRQLTMHFGRGVEGWTR